MVVFQKIYEFCHLEHKEENRILRRFVNSFSKAFSNQQSDDIRFENCNSIKRKHLNHEYSYHRCYLFIYSWLSWKPDLYIVFYVFYYFLG